MNAAVIVAAGRGTRMGLERNKVLAPLCGEPVIARTVRAFEQTGWFDGELVVITGACDLCEMKRILADAGLHAQVVLGGADRQESVCRGLAATNPEAKYVAIHDGARPLVTAEVIARTLESAKKYGSGVAAVPLKGYGEARERRRHYGRYPAARQPARRSDAADVRGGADPQGARSLCARRTRDGRRGAGRMHGIAVRLTEGDRKHQADHAGGYAAGAAGDFEAPRPRGKTCGADRHGYDVHRLTETAS